MNHSSDELISQSRIIVVGTVRNVDKSIEGEIHRLNRAVAKFKSVSFFIVESDSQDETIAALERLEKTVKNFHYITLGDLRNSIPNRIARLSKARNAYVDYVKVNKAEFDYVLVADLDGVNIAINDEKIATSFEKLGWGACTANQIGPYYDIYALRAKNWSETDCWAHAKSLIKDGVHPAMAWRLAIRDKQRKIDPDESWIEVDSAFGGLAIYATEAFCLGAYSADSKREKSVSEHVSFHEFLRDAGWSIYINPKMTNFDYNEHNDFHRISRRLKFAIKSLISLTLPRFFILKIMPDLDEKRVD